MQRYRIEKKQEFQTNGTSEVITTRFLERRDYDFDVVKSFLVVSMIIAHGFQVFYVPIYNKHLTYYVLIGFVFLSGLTIGSVYQEKLLLRPAVYTWVIFSRALKLLGIFLLSNIILILLDPGRLEQVLTLRAGDLLASALLRDGPARFSFAVLVSICMTFVGSIAFLSWRRRSLDLPVLGIAICALWVIEITGDLDYYTVKMTIVGLVGVLLSKVLSSLNWGKMKSILSVWYFVAWGCYIAYQAALIALDQEWRLHVGHYINVTILLLSAIYLTSFRMGLPNYRVTEIMNKSLGKYMLFAYLFHLFFLRVLGKFIGRGYFLFAICISLLTLCLTILAGMLVDVLTKKYKTADRLYSLVFK